MLSDIGTAVRRLFSLARGNTVPDDRRKRKRSFRDELENDDSPFGQRKQARYDFHNNRPNKNQGWLQWATEKPLKNYFVDRFVRCLRRSELPPPGPPRLRRLVCEQTVFSETMPRKASRQRRPVLEEPVKCSYEIQNSDSAVFAKPDDRVKQSRRRQVVRSQPLQSRQVLTPHTCVNLAEREEYRRLLSRYGASKKRLEVKEVTAVKSETPFAPLKTPSLQLSSQVTQPAVPKKLHHSIIDLCDSVVDAEVDRKEETVPLVAPKTSSSKISKSPYLSPWFLKNFKDQLLLTDEDRQVQIKKQKEYCQTLRALKGYRGYQGPEELRLKDEFVPCVLPEEVPAEEALPELTPEMDAAIDSALSTSPDTAILASGFRLTVTRRDMETLAGLNWLNDEVINFYMNLLVERGRANNYPSVYAFNTFFYPKLLAGGHSALKRWTRKVDLFAHDLVLVPVHLGAHWCLAVIDFRSKKIQYYDSMGGSNQECLDALREYLKEESMEKRKEKLDMSEWTLETVKGVPQQMNGSDCGMFALKYAEYICRNAKITFSQINMPYFRRRMVYEILTKRLL